MKLQNSFKMKYRNKKRKAAIYILKKLISQPSIRQSGVINNNIRQEVYLNPSYAMFGFEELLNASEYEKTLLRDACIYLQSNGYADILEDTSNIYNLKIACLPKGCAALKDEVIEDDIETYNNDRHYRYLRWVLPILSILIALLSLIFSLLKVSKYK